MAHAETKITLSRKRVVIIDDHIDVAESLAQWLTLAGHEVFVAHTGFEGISLVKEKKPNVVLLDIGLPDLNGYDVAMEVNSFRASLPPLTLVAVSGYGRSALGDFNSFQEAGFDQHFGKPIKAIELRTVGLDV